MTDFDRDEIIRKACNKSRDWWILRKNRNNIKNGPIYLRGLIISLLLLFISLLPFPYCGHLMFAIFPFIIFLRLYCETINFNGWFL